MDTDAVNHADTLFSGELQMARTPNQEIPGGSTALVVMNNTIVQEPPATLARMHASRERQIAFNKRVLEKENEVSAVNSELSDSFTAINLDKSTFVFLNVGERMRATQPICGRLCANDSRKMSATSTILPGRGGSRESVALSGISNVVTWRHVLELSQDHPRPGKRIVIYPDFLGKTGLILSTCNVRIDPESERWPVYEEIMWLQDTWHDSCRPEILTAGEPHLLSHVSQECIDESMEGKARGRIFQLVKGITLPAE
jgi:hypothetical protein